VSDARLYYPATQRNRNAIAGVLSKYIEPGQKVLEVASGSGEHAVFMNGMFLDVLWQPTDKEPTCLASIDAWRRQDGNEHLLPARSLDVELTPWGLGLYDGVLAINLIHIAPWTITLQLLRGARASLKDDGFLYLYGPYIFKDEPNAANNLAFDVRLRQQNPSWGVRDFDDVVRAADKVGLKFVERYNMPANNLSLIFRT
jgi:hypothetical protein